MHARGIGPSVLLACALGCQASPGQGAAEPLPPGISAVAVGPAGPGAPAPGAGSLSLMTWNVEWFQDPGEGPSDDPLQFERVLDVLRRTDADLIAVQEISAPAAFERIAAALPRHAGVLSEYRWTQKLGLLYDESRVRLRSVGALEGLDDAGRPPLDVRLELLPEAQPLRVVVVHAKASGDAESRATRARFAAELARRLQPATEPTLVLGDFNDGLGAALSGEPASTTQPRPSPYAPLLAAGFGPITGVLERPVQTERSAWIGAIDHILASEGLAARVVPGSVDVLQRELLAVYPDFTRTVSDHFPVVATFGP